jgi:hypothetical protein
MKRGAMRRVFLSVEMLAGEKNFDILAEGQANTLNERLLFYPQITQIHADFGDEFGEKIEKKRNSELNELKKIIHGLHRLRMY